MWQPFHSKKRAKSLNWSPNRLLKKGRRGFINASTVGILDPLGVVLRELSSCLSVVGNPNSNRSQSIDRSGPSKNLFQQPANEGSVGRPGLLDRHGWLGAETLVFRRGFVVLIEKDCATK
jgi:hypothetical protein